MSELWQDPYTLSVLVFVVFLALYVYRDRKKFERQSIVLLRRTTRGRGFIIKLADRFPRFWKHLGNLGVFACFAASVFVVYQLASNLFRAATVSGRPGGLAFLIPSPTATAAAGPGFLAVPFWYWIIAIGILVVVHEGLHGVMSVVGKVKIKSLGWGLLAVIPLAFVEPDEKALQKKSFLTQQRVFAAGSLANFILAMISIIILSFGFLWAYGGAGVAFQSQVNGTPAQQVNLTGVIVGIDNFQIKNTEDLSAALTQSGPNKEIEVKTKIVSENKIEDKSYKLTTIAEPNSTSNKGFIGIARVADAKIIKETLLPYSGPIAFFQGLFFFLFLINLGVGLANLLPIKPLDGGRMWETLLQRISRKHHKKILSVLGWLTLLLIVANFAVPFV